MSGRAAEGLPLLERAIEQGTSTGRQFGRPLWVAWLSEAHLRAGRLADAIGCAERALDLSRQYKERGHESYALHLLGEIHAHRAPPEAAIAETHCRQALALATELGMRPLVAHCHLGLGTLCQRTGDPPRAQEHLTTATTMYREMDMGFWLEKAEAGLREVE